MRKAIYARAWIAVPLALSMAHSARAQDAADVQRMVNQTLFAARDKVVQRETLERRRAEIVEQQRTRQQTSQLEEQGLAVQALRDEVRTLKDERRIIEQVEDFDAAIASRNWPLARSFLADTVTIDLPGPIAAGIVPADALIASWTRSSRPQPAPAPSRANQRVTIETDRAVLTADGAPWEFLTRSRPPSNPRTGQHEYRLARIADGWKIEALSFRSQPAGF